MGQTTKTLSIIYNNNNNKLHLESPIQLILYLNQHVISYRSNNGNMCIQDITV